MAPTIKEISVHYDPINESNTFASGDIVEGRAVLEVTKEIKVDSLFVKFTGDAHVHWTEGSDDDERSYSDHERYFKLKQYFIQDSSKRGKEEKNTTLITGEIYGQTVKPGCHVFPFRFQLPQMNMPPSFSGHHGWVKYILGVKLNRPWKMASTKSTELTFVLRNDGTKDHLLQPQVGTKDKKLKFFASGKTSITATTEKSGFMQGEQIKVFVDIDNSSSRDVKLKYSLKQCQTFIAGSSTNRGYKDIVKETKDCIPSGEKKQVTVNLKLPPDMDVTIENCRIIKVEYELKIYLDVRFASDPEIKFPVVILPFMAPWQGPPGGFQPNLFLPPAPPVGLPPAPAAGLYPCLFNPENTNPAHPVFDLNQMTQGSSLKGVEEDFLKF